MSGLTSVAVRRALFHQSAVLPSHEIAGHLGSIHKYRDQPPTLFHDGQGGPPCAELGDGLKGDRQRLNQA
jgi:hypothetical protein